jgi:hypothetical protein
MLGDYRVKYTLRRGEDQWCQELKFGNSCMNPWMHSVEKNARKIWDSVASVILQVDASL